MAGAIGIGVVLPRDTSKVFVPRAGAAANIGKDSARNIATTNAGVSQIRKKRVTVSLLYSP